MTKLQIQLAESTVMAEHAKTTIKLLEDQLASTLYDTTIVIDDVSAQLIDIGFEECQRWVRRLFFEVNSYLPIPTSLVGRKISSISAREISGTEASPAEDGSSN